MASSQVPKPRSADFRSEITRLPELTASRIFYRNRLKELARFVLWVFADVQVIGEQYAPRAGPGVVISNHLGDADSVLAVVYSPAPLDWFVKSELLDFPVLGKLIDIYGVIWVHRGRPDRTALRAAQQGLQERRLIALAPEGRESLTGGLEQGTHGAAYLALKSDAPLYPVTFTGTQNNVFYRNLKHSKRTKMTITFGPPFRLESGIDRRKSLRLGTARIMSQLASQLPPDLRGQYQLDAEQHNNA